MDEWQNSKVSAYIMHNAELLNKRKQVSGSNIYYSNQ